MAKGIFYNIDRFVFKQLDELKKSSSYQQFSDQVSTLSEVQQKYLGQITTVIIIALPLVAVSFFWLGNVSKRSDLESKEEILHLINNYTSKRNQIQRHERAILSTTSYQDQTQLNTRLIAILNTIGVGTSAININRFDVSSPVDGLKKLEAELTFKGLGITHLADFLQELVVKEKMKVSQIEIFKNNETNLLSGKFDILHIGRAEAKQE